MGRLHIKVVAITEARENDNVLCAATARPVLPGLDPCMAAENVLGNAIRCTERLQSDKQGTATAVGRLLPETLRLFDSASFREVGLTLGPTRLKPE